MKAIYTSGQECWSSAYVHTPVCETNKGQHLIQCTKLIFKLATYCTSLTTECSLDVTCECLPFKIFGYT